MRILCVIDSLGSGGAQRQLVNLAVGFKEKGHEVSLLVYHSINFFKKILDEKNIQVYEIIEPNYLKRLCKMRNFIRRGGFNSVLSFLEAANFICEIASLPGRKWNLVVGERSANPAILNSFKSKLFRWVHLLADFVVANSHENIIIIRKINPLLSIEKCHVIYNMIDFEKWIPKPENYELRKNKKFNLTVIASHQYLKNLHNLIEAVALLEIKDRNSLVINWYGGSSLDDSKKIAHDKINSYGFNHIFHFYEPMATIQQQINSADAIGLFSYYEGLPNVVCEGMAMGKPVISTAVSDIPLLISNANLLSNPSEPKSICKSLKYLLQLNQLDLVKEGNKNRELALILFNKEEIIQNYLNLLTK